MIDAYQDVFARFDAAGGGFVWTWNWAAFGGGAFWCFAKGLNKRGGMYILACILSGLYGLLLMPFIMGVCGNWLYYRFVRDNREQWFYGRGGQ